MWLRKLLSAVKSHCRILRGNLKCLSWMTVSAFPQIQAYVTVIYLGGSGKLWEGMVIQEKKENQRGTVSEHAVAVAPRDPIRPTALRGPVECDSELTSSW